MCLMTKNLKLYHGFLFIFLFPPLLIDLGSNSHDHINIYIYREAAFQTRNKRIAQQVWQWAVSPILQMDLAEELKWEHLIQKKRTG